MILRVCICWDLKPATKAFCAFSTLGFFDGLRASKASLPKVVPCAVFDCPVTEIMLCLSCLLRFCPKRNQVISFAVHILYYVSVAYRLVRSQAHHVFNASDNGIRSRTWCIAFSVAQFLSEWCHSPWLRARNDAQWFHEDLFRRVQSLFAPSAVFVWATNGSVTRRTLLQTTLHSLHRLRAIPVQCYTLTESSGTKFRWTSVAEYLIRIFQNLFFINFTGVSWWRGSSLIGVCAVCVAVSCLCEAVGSLKSHKTK